MGAILIAEDGGIFNTIASDLPERWRVAEYVAEDPADWTESWTGLRVKLDAPGRVALR